jgi:dTDP-4-amino-4,6-dideoxygalactose transaminase
MSITNHGKIPFLDLVTPHLELEEELVSIFRSALRSAGFIGGPMVEGFEQDFANFCGTTFCIGVGSGTDALRFALMAAGVKDGDMVITVPNTFIATTEAISQAGAYPGFVDIDEHTYNMDAERLREYLETQCHVGNKTRKPVDKKMGKIVSAIIPVHLFGQPANMDPLLELAKKYHLAVIEDACQAHGAEYFSQGEKTWKRVGSMGLAAAFSFYPGKNLGACGEAGAVTTNDEELARKVRVLRDHGQSHEYRHDVEGYNGRLDAIQAGVLKRKLSILGDWNTQRRRNAREYDRLFSGIEDVVTPCEASYARSVYHLYVIRTKHRARLKQHLAENGIGTGLHYPVPLHLQEAYRSRGYREGNYPVAERLAGELLSIPMYPGLTVDQQARVVQTIQQGLAALHERNS